MTDDDLFAELTQTVSATDPLPPAVLAAARAAGNLPPVHGLRLREVEQGMRAGADLIVLSAYGITVRVELGDPLTGVVTGTAGRIEARTPDGSWFAEIDATGRFTIEGVPHGPLSLRVHGEALLVGEWLTW
ncbi:hypothetical protein N8J89_39515 [Crossiella sp. CA-258035]|uniref:hypothetical protein n=1 Tax=Crossiella sp. CA-258035 TaxID=2981138 RepID=UPI0024BC3AE3|nr:hypothetical protein [Crossiella sp. CA-258035]WHT19115.1 hypothetical protein N8J89_39515 [Crossiella sp. CA-258035]